MTSPIQIYQQSSLQFPNAEHPNLLHLHKTINQETLQKKVATDRVNKLFLDGKLKNQKIEDNLREKKQRDEITSHFQPEILHKSKVILNKSAELMLGRSYNWQENKINKLQGQIEKKQAEEDQLLTEQTAQLNYVNQNNEKESKVKIHIDTLENKAREKKNRVVQKDPNFVAENNEIQPQRKKIDLLAPENQRKKQVYGFLNSLSADKKTKLIDQNYYAEFEKTKTLKVMPVK